MHRQVMNRNIEIKARVDDLAAVRERVVPLADEGPTVLEQEDTFFAVSRGRLKLRRFAAAPEAELIYYERCDIPGPKESHYRVYRTREADSLVAVLSQACGLTGVVRKRRTLHLIGQTRVHLDEVEGLGDFVELEVVLRADEDERAGLAVVRKLMAELGIGPEQLVEKAYVDLLA